MALHLREIRDGRGEEDLREAYLADALFKAMRFGLRGSVADPATGATLTMAEAAEAMLEAALAPARELGTEADVRILEEVLASGTEAEAQLDLLRELGDVRRVQLRLLQLAREELRDPLVGHGV